MADNVIVYSTALYTVASDDDGTAQHQYVKLEFGPDNTQTRVSALNPLPITGTALWGTITVGSSLPAGSAFLGTVANAGTVAVSSVVAALPAGANFLGTVANAGTVAVSSLIAALPAGSAFLGTVANAGTVAVSSLVTSLPAGTNTIGTVAVSGSLSTSGTVAGIGTFTTKETRSSTGTMSHVASSSSVVGLLNSNSNRLGFSVQNDATGNLYLGYGSNVSTTDYVARLTQYAYFEVPFCYTGTVCGLWSTVVASDGAARITEYS